MDQPDARPSAVAVGPLSDEDAPRALAVLGAAEVTTGLPLVDEAERVRLERLAGPDPHRPAGWVPIIAHVEGEGVGYAGAVVDGTAASGDAAVVPGTRRSTTVLRALLDGLVDVASAAGARHLQVWVRRADEAVIDAGRAAGFEVARRLGVLGRVLDEALPPAPPAAGARVRAYADDRDEDGVVAVLAAAYEGTDEAGWDLARFRERRGWPWFRPEDLLVAELEDGWLGGIHWLKRRGDGVGEVYNLAIHPRAQGRGLGPALLGAGLVHLREIGCREVLLWVDLANERAVRLYSSQGFTERWVDVALSRSLADHDDV